MTKSSGEVVRSYLESFGKSIEDDHIAYVTYLDDNVKYFTGTTMVHGKQNLVELVKSTVDAIGLSSWRCDIVNLVADGDDVCVERIDYQFDTDGNDAVVVPIMGFFKVKNSKIVEWRDYWDLRPLFDHVAQWRSKQGLPPLEWGDKVGAGAEAALTAAAN